jgi:hypothetical protein
MNRRQFLSTAALPAMLQGQSESGFVPLFDGKTLAGWKVKEGPETAFYVKDGAIVVHDSAGFPTWLSSLQQYENFDFRGEFFIQGWMNSGIYLHAPEHGRNIWCGMKINIFQDRDEVPKPESMGSLFPLVPPLKVNVKSKGEWNSFRILMDWPKLQVWTNDELIQDADLEKLPDFRHRLRRGSSDSNPSLTRTVSATCESASCHRSNRGRCSTNRPPISTNGTCPRESLDSSPSMTCSTAMASATSLPARSLATSSSTCTSAT